MVKKENIETLKRVLLIQLPVAGLACLALIYAISFFQARHHLTGEPEEEFQLLASSLEQKLEEVLSDATSQMQNLAQAMKLRGVNITPLVAEQVRDQVEGIDDVSIYDSFGSLLATTCDSPLEVGPYGDLFESALRGHLAVSRPVTLGHDDSRQTVLMLVPVMDEFEQPAMVLAGTFPMDDMWKAIDAARSEGEMSIAFLDTFGRVVAQRADDVLVGGTEQPSEEVVAASLESEPFKNKYYYITHDLSQEAHVTGPAWTILYLRPYATVTSLISRSAMLNMGMSAVTLGLMAFVGLTMVRRIQSPLRDTLEAADKVAKGELDVTLPEDGPPELKSIASAINQMSAEVRYHRQTMSAMVEARVRALGQRQEAHESTGGQRKSSAESTEEGVIVVDAVSGEILEVNKRMGALLDLETADIQALSAAQLGDTLKPMIHESVAFGNRWNYYCENPEEEGREEWPFTKPVSMICSVYTAPVRNEEDNVVKARLWMFRDITRQRGREIHLRQNQQIEAMSHMAGSMAHEFNNLLTVMVGNLSLARLEWDADEDALEYLESVREATNEATGLARKLLGFSNRAEPNLQKMNLNPILLELEEVLRLNMDPNLRIVSELASDLWDVPADAGQLQHAFTSAAMSDLDPLNGLRELRIGSSNVTLKEGDRCMPGEVGAGKYVRISFEQEQGSEFDEELVQESFFNSKEQKSPGLGASMAFGIVKKHGGWMTSTSEASEGTGICIYLPTSGRRNESMKTETLDDSSGARSKTCVLVVDDEPGVRRIAVSVLKRRGVVTLEAEDGEEALSVYQDNQANIGLVLLDMSMPKLSGRETFKRLKAMDEQLPVLICSGYPVSPAEFEVETGYAPSGVIQKPFELATLASEVCAVVGTSEVQGVSS